MKHTTSFLAILVTLGFALTTTSAKADPRHHHGPERLVGAVLGAVLRPVLAPVRSPIVVHSPHAHRPGCPCPRCISERRPAPPPPRGPIYSRGGYAAGPRFEGSPRQMTPQAPQQGGQQRSQMGGQQGGGQKPQQQGQGGGQKPPQQGNGQQRPNR